MACASCVTTEPRPRPSPAGGTVDDEEWWDEPEPMLGPLALTGVQVTVTDNPVVRQLLGADGAVLRVWRERAPLGF